MFVWLIIFWLLKNIMFFFGPSIGHLCLVVTVDMDIHTSSLDELAVTISATIRLRPSVKSLVISQSPLWCETFSTKFANIWPLSSMCPLMLFYNTFVDRAEITMLTLDFCSVFFMNSIHVLSQLQSVWKCFSTLLTDHGVQHMLSVLVSVKRIKIVICLGALVALQNLGLTMDSVDMV